jgi:hypothetical protein
MKRLEFTCDGCDLVEHVALPSDNRIDVTLSGWTTYHVVARENNSEPDEILSDLCPSCSAKMRLAINPANWPRMDSTVKRIAK